MLRFRSSFINGVQNLVFNHGFRQLLLCSTSISTEEDSNFASYLVANLGFPKLQAHETCFKFTEQLQDQGKTELIVCDSNFVENADSVITFLQKIGLQKSHIQNAVFVDPTILLYDVEKDLNPKFTFFLKLGFFNPDVAKAITANSKCVDSYKLLNPGAENVDQTVTLNNDASLKLGFSDSDIDALVSANPSLDLKGLGDSIALAIQALREIMGCEECGVEVCGVEECQVIPILNKLSRRKHSLYDVPNCMVPNVAFLRSCGVLVDEIRHYLHRRPYVFVSDTDIFQNTVARVEEILGVPPNTPGVLVGVEVFPCYNNEFFKSKMQLYRSYRWTDSDIVIHLLSSHEVLRLSKYNIKKKLDFLMNELGYDPTYLAPKCNLFTSSVENKLVPRFKVLEVLKKNGWISEDYDLWAVIKYTNSEFLNEFVLPYMKVHEVYSQHAGIFLEVLRLMKPNSTAV